MKLRSIPAGAALLLALPATAALPPVQPADQIAAMIAAAYRTGDENTIKAVVSVAKATFPDLSSEIDRLSAGDAGALQLARKQEQARERARIAAAGFFDIWKGELEAGATRSTGSTNETGLYGSAAFNRDGLKWRQKLSARVDYQRTDDETTTDRITVAYQPSYKLDDRTYIYGLAQYEHDRELGYDHRFTAGVGLGYQLLAGTTDKLELEGGPAIRRTDYFVRANRTAPAARASLSAHIALSQTLAFGEEAALFFEPHDTTASATTSLDTKLIGALKARLSYNIQYEQNSPERPNALDTISRATLVYSF